MSDGRRNVSEVSRRCLVRVIVGKNLGHPGSSFSGSNLCAKVARARKVVCLSGGFGVQQHTAKDMDVLSCAGGSAFLREMQVGSCTLFLNILDTVFGSTSS